MTSLHCSECDETAFRMGEPTAQRINWVSLGQPAISCTREYNRKISELRYTQLVIFASFALNFSRRQYGFSRRTPRFQVAMRLLNSIQAAGLPDRHFQLAALHPSEDLGSPPL